MKKYKKPLLINDSTISKGFAPLVAQVAALSVGGAAAIGAAIGLAKGRDYKTRMTANYLKPIEKS